MKDDDLLARMMKRRGRSNTLTPKVLRQSTSAPLPPNVEIIQGRGGSVVYRTWIGSPVTGNVPKPS